MRFVVPPPGRDPRETSTKGIAMFFDIDLTILAAVTRERELQRTLAAERARDEQR
ncbi:hypothetical protein HMPREF1318_0991 [Actinomyces massiliensis F0489]|uniref:Uncharacterized protein n=1 Tax=Actinomyces massiliensis F0489 TaxID=1125718 RepID=J1HJC2_9ACTO|nr:hypothetical protein HMPREF1318_0991 [Actinomyces massiliensis F0489]